MSAAIRLRSDIKTHSSFIIFFTAAAMERLASTQLTIPLSSCSGVRRKHMRFVACLTETASLMYHQHGTFILNVEKRAEPHEFQGRSIFAGNVDILNLDACSLSDLIADRKIFCTEVVFLYLDHIERTNAIVNVPTGFSDKGLPMGLQISAPGHDDLACVLLARDHEHATHWCSMLPPPAFADNWKLTDGCSCA